VTRERREREPFVSVPRRLDEALLRGEMTDRTYSVASFLCAAADYSTGLYVGTLAMIADGMQWTGSHDTLTRSLAKLKDGAWIDFESTKGQRKPYEIRLTGLLVRDRPTQDLRMDPPSLALVSYADPSSDSPAIPRAESGSASTEPTHPVSVPSTSTSLGGKDKEVGPGTRSSSAEEPEEELEDVGF
jgi:hypothetical protein